MFSDEAFIHVRAGNGGNGCVSFLREKYRPKGGPDGGPGGKGGDVILHASAHSSTLLDFVRRKMYQSPHGGAGQRRQRAGLDGEDLILKVPVGTLVFLADGTLLVDLAHDGQECVVARGGRGGWGNMHFATSTNQTPRTAEEGGAGESRDLHLELKLIADVGLVGLPNAGKSMLLSRISAATPKVADYPFTTLEPQLGIVELSRGNRLVVADIPGLIEGAHLGKGLGDKFLRHLERTKILIHLVDLAALDGENPAHAFSVVRGELQQYSPQLFAKPFLVAATKMDLTEAKQNLPVFQEELGADAPIFPISSVTKKGITPLLRAIWHLVQQQNEIARSTAQETTPSSSLESASLPAEEKK